MGYIAHDAIIVTCSGYALREGADLPIPPVEAFREAMPEELRHLLVGPVQSATNDFVTYAFLPDGSKMGWGIRKEADELRKRFAALFAATYEGGSSPFDLAWVRYGCDFGSDHGVRTITPVAPA